MCTGHSSIGSALQVGVGIFGANIFELAISIRAMMKRSGGACVAGHRILYLCSGSSAAAGATASVTLVKSVNASGRIDKFLLAGKERMAS